MFDMYFEVILYINVKMYHYVSNIFLNKLSEIFNKELFNKLILIIKNINVFLIFFFLFY